MKKNLLGAIMPLLLASCSKGDDMDKIRAPEIRVQEDEYWINSPPLSMKELKGKAVLVDIWDYTCVNCIRTLPYIKEWHEKYSDKGLVIIGVHAPEFEFAKTRANVEKAVQDFGIRYPVVMDNRFEIWTSYANMYWPRKYLVDAKGYIRYDHAGEGGYEETERKIQELLAEIDPSIEFPAVIPDTSGRGAKGKVCYPMTPELYVGYERGRIGNPEGYKPGQVVDYARPEKLVDGLIYAYGAWRNEAEAMIHARITPDPTDYIGIRYHALEVNAVIKPEKGEGFRVWVKQDGKWVKPEDGGSDLKFDSQGASYLEIGEPRMYRIIRNAEYGAYDLHLYSTSDGLGIYAFTFGACM
ncbi:redoxin domain-containing protein [candidate division WOR-3 bacterium]|nr:redoxin domain-containing protein [candidate division WOR-3 bacterium]